MEYSSVDTTWVLISAALVFFMQAGFAMVETGFTRAKNAGNIIMKNLMDFSIGTVAFWCLGFGLMFAGSGAFIGGFDIFIRGDYSSTIPTSAFVIFQTVFCATSATIVSGAMAERTKFSSYCIYSLILSALIYPISGHWIWGGGWLSELGFHDFAGSTAVHLVGGVAALIGAKIVGPRIGKFSASGKPRAIMGHSLTLGALGVFILWFCWFGFNGGSTVSMTGDNIVSASSIFVNTNLAAATACCVVMGITWIMFKKPDISLTLNGALAGLVAITAGCDLVSPVGAFIIGILAGVIVVFGSLFIERVLKIDDPVGAISVHGLCGAAGTIFTGLFATEQGLFYGGGWRFLGVQLLGVVAVTAWVAVTITIVFLVLKHTIGLRVKPCEEKAGLDIYEHGLTSSYADFIQTPSSGETIAFEEDEKEKAELAATTDEQDATEIQDVATVPPVDKHLVIKPSVMTKVVIVTNQSKFEVLKTAMDKLGVTGMTVTQVLGRGMQTGGKEYYRGSEIETVLMPKVKVEIVVCKIPLDVIIPKIKEAIGSNGAGDGKIFTYRVESVVRVRNGETDYDALQDEES